MNTELPELQRGNGAGAAGSRRAQAKTWLARPKEAFSTTGGCLGFTAGTAEPPGKSSAARVATEWAVSWQAMPTAAAAGESVLPESECVSPSDAGLRGGMPKKTAPTAALRAAAPAR